MNSTLPASVRTFATSMRASQGYRQSLRTMNASIRGERTGTALSLCNPRAKALLSLSSRPKAPRALQTFFSVRQQTSATAPSAPAPAAPTEDPFAHLPAYKPPTSGVLSLVPASWVPYLQLMRVEKTGGLYAFYMPYLAGMGWAGCIASPTIAPSDIAYVASVLLAWTVWHRGAVCTINDLFDAEFDRKVERCRHRPVARRAVTDRQAWVWYWTQCAVSAGFVTLLPHSTECFTHAVPIVFGLSVYPLFKRWTNYPQLILAPPLAWSVFMTCAALGVDPWTVQSGTMAAATMCLVASKATYFVQLDYVNACQDTMDDIKAGVKSMAVRFQDTGKFIATLGTLQVSLLAAAGYLAGLGPIYFAGAVGGNAVVMATMARTVDRTKPKVCAWWFLRGSLLIGATTITGVFAEYYSRLNKAEEKSSISEI